MYRYLVTKMWYNDEEIIESEIPLNFSDIRKQIDERRIYCDEIDVEELDGSERN